MDTATFWCIVCLTTIFTFITKEKLNFSLICSFYCCLVKKGWALKVASQFTIWWQVAYKPVVYKKKIMMFTTKFLPRGEFHPGLNSTLWMDKVLIVFTTKKLNQNLPRGELNPLVLTGGEILTPGLNWHQLSCTCNFLTRPWVNCCSAA